MTSQWARWCLKSPASTLITQPFVQGADQWKYQSSVSLAFVRGIHRGPVNSPHKGPVTRKIFPFDDVIMLGCTMRLWNGLNQCSYYPCTSCIFDDDGYSDWTASFLTDFQYSIMEIQCLVLSEIDVKFWPKFWNLFFNAIFCKIMQNSVAISAHCI